MPSKTHILNRLHRLIDGKLCHSSEWSPHPQALASGQIEPRADVELR